VVHLNQAGPIQQAGRYVIELCLPYDVDAQQFGLFHYSFVDVQGVSARRIMYSAILSFLPEVISKPHFIAVVVDLILSV
jgi:hypothetical protein